MLGYFGGEHDGGSNGDYGGVRPDHGRSPSGDERGPRQDHGQAQRRYDVTETIVRSEVENHLIPCSQAMAIRLQMQGPLAIVGPRPTSIRHFLEQLSFRLRNQLYFIRIERT